MTRGGAETRAYPVGILTRQGLPVNLSGRSRYHSAARRAPLSSPHFGDRLADLVAQRGPVCAGIDPRPEQLPVGLGPNDWAEELGRLLGPRVPALKPQLAFFDDAWEGPERSARAGLEGGALSIADCKRGDIDSTAAAYARRILGPASPFAAATVNPWLGRDSLQPFVDVAAAEGKGLFVLVHTSNPGAADLQGLVLEGGERVYERAARIVDELGAKHVGRSGLSLVGAVVGLTVAPEVVARLRSLMPRAPFLMPGYGAQGGSPAALEAARIPGVGGVLVNASRSLTFPWKGAGPPDWREQTLAALEAMRRDLG